MNAEEFEAAVKAVDLTAEDATAQILELNKGLMNSNNDLLTESKANKTAAQEAAEATELARKAATDAEEQRLIASGETDKLKAHYEKQLAEGKAEANQLAEKATGALNARDKGDVISEILSGVDDRFLKLVKTQLNLDTSISYGENGEIQQSIKHGDNSYSSVAEFLDGVKDTEWKHYLKATSMSGANTKQSNGDNFAPGDKNSAQSNLAARLKAQGLTQ